MCYGILSCRQAFLIQVRTFRGQCEHCKSSDFNFFWWLVIDGLVQWVSNFNVQTKLLGILKFRFWLSRSGVGPNNYISYKLPVNAADLWTTFRVVRVRDTLECQYSKCTSRARLFSHQVFVQLDRVELDSLLHDPVNLILCRSIWYVLRTCTGFAIYIQTHLVTEVAH